MGSNGREKSSLTLDDLLRLELDRTYLEGIIPNLKGLKRFQAEQYLRNIRKVLENEQRIKQSEEGATISTIR